MPQNAQNIQNHLVVFPMINQQSNNKHDNHQAGYYDGVEIKKYEYPLFGKIIVYLGLLSFAQYIVFCVVLELYRLPLYVPSIMAGFVILLMFIMDRYIRFFKKMKADPVLRGYSDHSWKWGGFLFRTMMPNRSERERYPFLLFFGIISFSSPCLAVLFAVAYIIKINCNY